MPTSLDTLPSPLGDAFVTAFGRAPGLFEVLPDRRILHRPNFQTVDGTASGTSVWIHSDEEGSKPIFLSSMTVNTGPFGEPDFRQCFIGNPGSAYPGAPGIEPFAGWWNDNLQVLLYLFFPDNAGNALVLYDIDACTADTNNDGILTPADYNAWILAFNAQSPACDQNVDGLCTPADYSAWIVNFNAGCP